MSFAYRIAPAAAIVLLSCLVAPAASFPAVAQTPAMRGVEGSWAGPFAQADWTFEFKQNGGVWSGRYMSSKGNKWHDLLSLNVSGNSVTFEVESKPQVRFDLKVDARGKGISGVISIGSGLTVPFSAVRRS